jgi:drug/metabolite transporter (DMT)-like permease
VSLSAFSTLLLIAFMMGSNHVAARFAFQNGVDVATAVTMRSGVTALVLALLIWQQKVHIQLTRQKFVYLLVCSAHTRGTRFAGIQHLPFVDHVMGTSDVSPSS